MLQSSGKNYRTAELARLQRLDTTLLRRVLLFVEAAGGRPLTPQQRASWTCAVYELAWRDCRERDLDPETLDLERYRPVIEVGLEGRAA